MFNDISKQKKLELKSEKEEYDSLQVMLHRCKEQNLDVRTVMRTLLNESINFYKISLLASGDKFLAHVTDSENIY